MQYDAVLFDFDGVVVETPSRRRLAVDVRAADNAGIDSALLSRSGTDSADAAVDPTSRLSSLAAVPSIVD
ncbi:haloacid dehalogenase [Natrinema mahii]|nr:haloacid dehalogenase [Natrinema mahii]